MCWIGYNIRWNKLIVTVYHIILKEFANCQIAKFVQNCPRISNYLGGSKNFKILTYLVLKWGFFRLSKNLFSRISGGYPEIFLKVQKIDFYCIFKPQFSENLPKIS